MCPPTGVSEQFYYSLLFASMHFILPRTTQVQYPPLSHTTTTTTTGFPPAPLGAAARCPRLLLSPILPPAPLRGATPSLLASPTRTQPTPAPLGGTSAPLRGHAVASASLELVGPHFDGAATEDTLVEELDGLGRVACRGEEHLRRCR